MFYYISGTVTLLEPDLAVIDCGGVGYCLHTTANTVSKLQVGKTAKLYTYCSIREDAFDLFGFYDMTEKRTFEMLISVSGIGPKAAQSILSSATPESLAVAIINGEEKALTSAPGIGKKIAQRVILELKDKISKEFGKMPTAANTAAAPAVNVDDAVKALMVLGYTQAEVRDTLKSADLTGMSVEDIIRYVLKSSLKEG